MESCHSVLPPISRKVPHPPTYRRLPPKIYSTLGHLIEIIEQLHSRENLGLVLQNLVAEVDDKSSANSLSSYVDLDPGTIIKIAQILRKLNANCATMMTETHGTGNVSSASLEAISREIPGRSHVGGERAHRATADGRNLSLSKQDSLYLMKKIKDFEQKCKPLQEKNKKFLEKNMELSTQNRSLKEQIRNIADENKKLKDNLDLNRRKCNVLSKQLNEEKLEKGNLEVQLQELTKLKKEILEQTTIITNLKQAAAEKDRRMEVLQHRKKRRLRMSAEHLSRLSSPCSTIDDERSQDSDLSTSSVSVGNLSDDDIEELPQDESEKVEKNYKKLMKEHLLLEKSTTQIQNQLGWKTDPQRYIKTKLDFETDMYIAQCKIENLEECLAKYKDYDNSWVMEKEELVVEKEAQNKKIQELKRELRETTQAYDDLKEQTEHLEFLVLETQESKNDSVCTEDASTSTDEDATTLIRKQQLEKQARISQEDLQANEILALQCSEAQLRVDLEMSEGTQQEYKSTIKDLEEKLRKLLNGQDEDVNAVMLQLQQAEQEKSNLSEQLEKYQQDAFRLTEKLVQCEQENSGLTEKLARYKGKLDSQEQSLALTRDEREELLQVKPKPQVSVLNNRLRLAEMGQDSVRERSLEREGSQERICSPLMSPRSVSDKRLPLSVSNKNGNQSSGKMDPEIGKEADEHFESLEANMEYIEPVNYDNLGSMRPRLRSMPSIGADHSDMFSEVDKLQRQIQDLQEENDVLKFELTTKGHRDSDGSGSDSEDSRVAELRETCENLRERLQSAEAMERQCKDRLKLAEKHITELEQAETVLRDRVEEGNTDCDKLRKQIVRLQRKIRELKDMNIEKETQEQALLDKVKFLEDAEAQFSQKVTDLESSNHMLKQRLDVKDELLADVQLVETLTQQVKTLQAENNNLESKMIDLEENNEFLRENWRKVADEEANRRECLEEKIRVLESTNKDLKSKITDHETDLDLSSGPSIASEINEDAIEQLNERIKDLEADLESKQHGKDEKIASLGNLLKNKEDAELELKNTVAKLEKIETELRDQINGKKSEDSDCLHISTSEIKQYQDEINELRVVKTDLTDKIDAMQKDEDELKLAKEELTKKIESMQTVEDELKIAKAELTDKIESMQKVEDELKLVKSELTEKIEVMQKVEDELKASMSDIEKSHEKKLATLQNEISEYQQHEDDLCVRIEELEEIEVNMNNKIDKLKESEMNFKNKIEELENRETSLTIQFSKRMEELEKNEKEISERFYSKIEELENRERDLSNQVETLESENTDLVDKVYTLENREKELENKKKELAECVEQLACEKTGLLEKVNSLEKHEKEIPEKDEIRLPEQENVELVQYESSTAGASVVLQDKYNSDTKLESEVSVINGSKFTDLQTEIELLQEENTKLKSTIQEAEKEHKALEDKFKRQEKKRKRSERADNVDDYDTIAREVVTYKLEVDQLRTENNDLHERIMELDESEKNLQEQNEQLACDIEELRKSNVSEIDMSEVNELKQKIEDMELSNLNEVSTLQKQIESLELREAELKAKLPTDEKSEFNEPEIVEEEIVAENQSNVDASFNDATFEVKETADKNIGTDDFMEGVMGSQDQGKPVSSMFERIQILENENQDLSTKLSVLTATDAQVRQLSEKVKSLEENEDSLMERVMELEDEEDRLKRELSKVKQRASSITELEDELTVLQENEEEMNSTIDTLKLENETLKKTMDSSTSEKGDIAIRLAKFQKLYEDEKKKVESLLQGEERWMKSVSSEKKAVKEMEDELASTQEKLEELQTEYENKLSAKDEGEKVLKDEINKINREKEVWKKKLQEYEKSNSELEDEIEACKISESRMFHRHQQLITQNEELELKLSKLVKLIPNSQAKKVLDSSKNKSDNSSLMAENPEVISENPLTASIFTESELDLLRNKTPDAELLGAVPLDMLRKMHDFDQREQNYQSKVNEMEAKSIKLAKKIMVMQGKEKDLKHENKELQLELFKLKGSDSSLRASTSSLDFDRSGSDDGLDSDNGLDDKEVFDSEDKVDSQYDNMTQEELLLTLKLQDERHNQDMKKMADFEEWLKDMIEQFGGLLSSESFDVFIKNAEALTITLKNQNQSEGIKQSVLGMLETVTSLRQRLEAIQNSEEQLRVSLAEKEMIAEKIREDSKGRIEQLEAQIHAMAKLTHKYQSTSEASGDTGVQSREENSVWEETETGVRCTSSIKEFHLETSKTINIDVPPTQRVQSLSCLDYSETVNVNVPPSTPVHPAAADSYYGYQYDNSPIMMDKAEDVLRQRIRELEKLEKHLRQQVTDLESDREELHEIARKDKAIIHEQNVRLRELQLSQRNLQEQINNFETSETSLYGRLDELEAEIDNKDDRIRDLEILEQRLKDLVKQYKLDEKILQTKSQSLESSVHEMSAKEETLKQKVQNLETEKCAFSERSEYLQLRLKELESAETDLAQRAQNQENIMQTLQNTVIELETFGANAHTRVVELEHINFDLQQRLHHSMTENSPLSKQSVMTQQKCDQMESELVSLRDADIRLRQENESLLKSENSLQHEVKTLRIKEIELDGKVRDLMESDSVMKDRLSKLQRNENTLRYRVQELESSGIQAPSDLSSSQTSNMKLPRTLEDCQRRIIVLQTNNAELQSRLQQASMEFSGTSPQEVGPGTRGTVPVPQTEYQTLQRKVQVLEQTENQLEQSDRLNSHLQETVAQLREGKDVCGHEVEIEVLREHLNQANQSVKMLQTPSAGQWNTQGPNLTQQNTSPSPRRKALISDLMGHLEGEEVKDTMSKATAASTHLSRPQGQGMSRDHMIQDLMRSLEGPSPRPSEMEDDHWKEIETRMEAAAAGRGDEQWISVGKATSMYATDNPDKRSHGKNEVLELGLALQSESESVQNYQNDTDSGRYGNRISPNIQQQRLPNSQVPSLPQSGPPRLGHMKTTDGFGDSLYLQSSAQDSLDEISDQNKEVLLRRSGQASVMTHMSAPSITESMADSGRGTASVSLATSALTLRERIAHIEKQLSARESDSAREFNSELDLTSWKARVHESNRKLELAEKDNKHCKDEINKLEKELEDKTRLYAMLEAFLKFTQSLLQQKDSTPEKELIAKLEAEVEKVTTSLEAGGLRPDDHTLDPAALNTELAKKDRELNAKRNEVDSLMRELRQWQEECRSIEAMRSNALDSLRGLEVEVNELQLADKHLKDLKDDYNTLKGQFIKLVEAYAKLEHVRQHHEEVAKERDDLDIEVTGLKSKVMLLEGQLEVMEGVSKEKKELNEELIDLRNKINDHEKVEIEKASLEKNVEVITELLNERMKKVESLTEELFEVRKKMSNNDRDNYKLRQQSLSPHSSPSSSNIDTQKWTDDSKKAQSVTTAPLRARIVQLTSLCNEKDVLIKKLVQELKRLKSGARSSPLVDELCRLDSKSDHNHNLLHRTSSQSSIDSMDRMSVVSDTELIRDDHGRQRVPRPRSADIHQRNSSHRHSYHGSTNLPRSYRKHPSTSPVHRGSALNNGRNNIGMHSPHLPHPPSHRHASSVYGDLSGGDTTYRTTQYVAIADYDPATFSQSGHPRLELSLTEGDIVLVTGPMHDNGYVEGEVRGQVGLVPLSYLQASSPHRSAGGRRVPDHLNASPERIAQLYTSLHGVHQPNTHVPFHVYGDMESDKLLLEISNIDNMKPSQSETQTSAKLDQIDAQKTKATVTNSDDKKEKSKSGLLNGSVHRVPASHRTVQVSIGIGSPDPPDQFHVEKIIGNNSLMLAWQPVNQDNNGYNKDVKVTGYRIYKNNKLIVQPHGRLASKAIIENVNIQTAHRFGIQTVGAEGQSSELSEIMYEGVEEVTSDENSDTESEMDMATVLNVDEYKSGSKRTFMGVYDYDPTKNSPYDHPSCELALNAGDIITVYGRQRGDGFYYGEINGVRGLVPTFFIEEMPQPPPRTKKMAKTKQTVREKTDKKTDHRTS